ncbi:serine/threonine-protein kinase [Caulobacter sp. KR2-114]|uniref:serine/threonine-protein kinase n=1 Tax=Caulobacter sp. KR2-114 TaxID=3400912 RepID=UPI003C087BB2
MSETPQTIGRYRVDQVLGRGSMGVVYRGHDPEIDRPVAIKLVRIDLLEGEHREDYLARFRREVQAAGRCMHRNIVAMYDFGSHEGNPFFVMEYVDAPAMDQAVPRGVGLGPHGATPIILQLLDALSLAHSLGIVHRDIKPSNLLLTPSREVKVMDFGISHMSTSHLTQVGSVLGTPRYMSPEQFRGDPVDARSDLFSTGAVLHELLTGRPAVAGRSFEEVMVRLLHDGIELAPADAMMPEPMREVVIRAMALRPEDRFPDAESMATALRRALAEVEARGDDVPQAEARTVYRPVSTPAAAPAAASPAPASAAPPPAPPAAAQPATPQTLADAEVLGSIERRLAQHIGPLAGRLVRDALKEADSVDALCESLALRIDPASERDSFLRDVRRQLQATAERRAPGVPTQTLFMPAPPAPVGGLSAQDTARIQHDLTLYLGPFAAVLVKRAATQASSPDDLRQRLSDYVEDPAQREAFLKGR